MTDPMPTIMQAAERLRRVANREASIATVYWPEVPENERTGSQQLDRRLVEAKYRLDYLTLADFALSILPKGDRPGKIQRGDEVAATLSYHWELLDKLIDWAENA